MAKGSGRRRITPSDGIKYDPETDMTNIEMDGGLSFMSAERELYLGLRTGAPPTSDYDYGSHSGTGTNGRRGGRGRKNDHRNWKSYGKGKQYEHNLVERTENLEVPDKVKRRLREKSINADITKGFSCAEWSKRSDGFVILNDVKPFNPEP